MLVLITYDVNTEDAGGRKRLRKVAKECVNYGQRVQNSVFECVLDAAQYRLVKHKLEQLIDTEKDSLRFYNLGNNYQTKIGAYWSQGRISAGRTPYALVRSGIDHKKCRMFAPKKPCFYNCLSQVKSTAVAKIYSFICTMYKHSIAYLYIFAVALPTEGVD